MKGNHESFIDDELTNVHHILLDQQLEECSRDLLERETVYYCSSQKERDVYEICFCDGLLHRRAHPGEEKQEGEVGEETL